MNIRQLFVASLALAGALSTGVAQAGGVHWSVGIQAPVVGVSVGTVISNGPVYSSYPSYPPSYPVYPAAYPVYSPPPVVYVPAPVVRYRPAPPPRYVVVPVQPRHWHGRGHDRYDRDDRRDRRNDRWDRRGR